MCGIFGMFSGKSSGLSEENVRSLITKLLVLSESRGKEAAGLAVRKNGLINVYKQPCSASEMIATSAFQSFLKNALSEPNMGPNGDCSLALIGHSRLMTNGAQGINTNNQPVVKRGIVTVHNGIIINANEIRERDPGLPKETDLDTEIFVDLLSRELERGETISKACSNVHSEIKGAASTGSLLADYDVALLATNTGSLYVIENEDRSLVCFTSEMFMLEQMLKDRTIAKHFQNPSYFQASPGTGHVIELDSLRRTEFSLDEGLADLSVPVLLEKKCRIVDISNREVEARNALRRCRRCILPETMPFITFDKDGVCNYCHNHQEFLGLGRPALNEMVSKYRRNDKRPECLVSFSGGRDSSYGLHYVTQELGLRPVTYTYDWGMVTDLARRNISRLCGQLRIENILVSADIKRKRRNIRKNVLAWLKRPTLGMIPLFMAGDKQYFYYAEKVRRQAGVDLTFFFGNSFEKTNFKTGFCGIEQESTRLYNTAMKNKLKLLAYYGKEFLLNPRYLNPSLVDTAFAYYSSYMMKHNFYWLFNYIPWDEREIDATLRDVYDWETATDTKATWRIGDGTAAFYNYIYYTVAGFSEHDTLQSNKIREGVISRESALKSIEIDNQPRFDSIQKYLNLICVDFDETMRVINLMPKLYM